MRIRNIIITVFFLFAIVLPMVLFARYKEDSELLYVENRKPAAKPEFTADNVFNQDYFGRLEDYLKDAFIGRNDIVELDTFINKSVLFRPVVNDIYCGKNMYLSRWKRVKPYDYQKDLDYMSEGYGELSRRLKDKGIDFIYVGIPEHSYAFADDYPSYLYNKYNEWKEIEDSFFDALHQKDVQCIRMSEKIKNVDSEYTKTDHHFSYVGAKNVYNEIIKRINEATDYNLDSDVQLIQGLEPFKGSYARKLFFLGDIHDDYFVYAPDFPFERFDNGSKSENKLFFQDNNKYLGNMTYGIYMNGDVATTEIHTNRDHLPNILVYGDSFTNPLETLLVRNADNFCSVDFRYQRDKGLMDFIEAFHPDIVLCIRDNLNYLDRDGNGILN